MKDFRKGNDLMIKWAIVAKDGLPYLLPDKSYLRIEAHTASRSVDSIEITEVSGNILTAMYYGKDQRYTGEYTLTLIENEGFKGMHTIDECKAFDLVSCSCLSSQEDCDCAEDGNIEVSTVELESTLLIGIDNTEGGGGGGGSDLNVDIITSGEKTTPSSDTSVYSSLATDTRFLNKISGGTVEGNVTFKENIEIAKGKAIQSEGYDDEGTGFKLYKTNSGLGVLEVDKLQAKSAIFDEIVINQINFQRGTTVFSCAGCTIEGKVEGVTVGGKPAYKCYYDNKDGERESGFVIGDLARCQRFDENYNLVVKYYWRKVLGVGADYVVLSDVEGECHGDGTPEEHDDIVQFGNMGNINRQSAIVITPYGTDIVDEKTVGGSVIVLANLGAGTKPFALTEKNYIGMGVKSDGKSSKAYIYGYGDMYFGDRGNSPSQFIEYKDGKLNIKGNVTIGGKDGGEDRSLDQVINEADEATANALSAAEQAAVEAEKASATAEKAAQKAIEDAVKDGSITASEKVVLFREQKYIYAQYDYITGEIEKYSLPSDAGTNYSKYVARKVGYDSKLTDIINNDKGIVLDSDLEVSTEGSLLWWQREYYVSEAVILSDISNAAKALADAAKTQANGALTAAAKAVAATGGLNDDKVLSLIEKQSLRLQLRVITENTESANLSWGNITHTGDFTKVAKGDISNDASQDAWAGWFASQNTHEDIAQDSTGLLTIYIGDSNRKRKISLQFASDAERNNDILYVGALAINEDNAVIEKDEKANTTLGEPWKQTTTYGKMSGAIMTKEYEFPYDDDKYATWYYIPLLFAKNGTISENTDRGYYRVKNDYSYFLDNIQYFGYEGSFHLLYAQLKNMGLEDEAKSLQDKLSILIKFYNLLGVYKNESSALDGLLAQDIDHELDFLGIGTDEKKIRPALQKCFADYFDYVDICEEAIRRKDLSDVEYLKEVFPNNLDVDGASLAYLLGVKNTTDKIVAGLYGGASLELNKTGLYDNTATKHGTLMIFAGANGIENVSGAATRIYEDGTIYTNKLIAGGGEIGGFSIGTDSLTTVSSNLDSEVRSTMILNKKGIEFYRYPKGSTDEDKRLVIGTSIYSSSGYNELLSIENEESNLLTNYGIRVNVSGGSKNYALVIESGDIVIKDSSGTYVSVKNKLGIS